jgi:hypothetical protein
MLRKDANARKESFIRENILLTGIVAPSILKLIRAVIRASIDNNLLLIPDLEQVHSSESRRDLFAGSAFKRLERSSTTLRKLFKQGSSPKLSGGEGSAALANPPLRASSNAG